MQSYSDEAQEPIVFRIYWLILQRRWLPAFAVAVCVFGLAAAAACLQKPIYEAEGKLLLSKRDRVSSLTDLTDQVEEISGLTQTTNPLDTEVEIIQSVPLVEKTIRSLNLKDAKGQNLEIDQFLKQIKVKAVRGTDVMALTYRGSNPQEVAAAVNSLMQHYLENNVRLNRAEAVAAREFIRKQLPDVERRVTAAEAALRQFKEANGVVALEEEAKGSVEGMRDLTDQITTAKAKLADATSRTAALQRQIGLNSPRAIALTTISQSTAVQAILTEYRKVQDQLAVQRTRYQPEHPEIANLVRQEAALKQQLELRLNQALDTPQAISDQDLQLSTLKQTLTEALVKAEAERLGLANQVTVLSGAMGSFSARASILPQLEQTQRELERRLQVARSTYEQLLKRLQEVEVAENQNVGNARIVSAARVPNKAISPRIFLSLAIGGGLGCLAGLFAALLLDAIDKSVKSAEEAQKLAGYPLLGIIPWVGTKNRNRRRDVVPPLPARDQPCSAIGTPFEMLQTTLGFTLSDQPLKVILVTSAVAAEGKSFISANLAVATAQMGRRVLLVDADLRDPCQHEIWQQMNLKGLSDVLVDQATFPETVKTTYPNLDVLTAGTTPPNPVALLGSQRLAALLESAIATYDFIIFDTPPLTLAPDGLTLGKLVDGILFVVQPGVADSAAVTQAKALLTQSGQRVLGLVVNGKVPDRNRSYPDSSRRSSTLLNLPASPNAAASPLPRFPQ